VKIPCAFAGQSLEDHTKGVIEIIKKLFISDNYHEVVADRLKRNRIDAHPDDVKRAILIAAGFHDIGKAIEYYQSNFNDQCSCINCTFPYHEIFSASSILHPLTDVFSEELRFFIIMSIVNHLIALRPYEGYEYDFNKVNKIISKDKNKFVSCEKICEIVYNETGIKIIPEEPNQELIEDLKNYLKNSTQKPSISITNSNISYIRHSYQKLYTLFLLPIVIGDNLDSSSKRKKDENSKKRRLFIEELEKYYGENIWK
jgi:CRISPR-associated endonuclease Cas3-HD